MGLRRALGVNAVLVFGHEEKARCACSTAQGSWQQVGQANCVGTQYA